MESVERNAMESSSKPGFFKHLFNFDEDSKADMYNLVQYIVMAMVPIVLLNKGIQRFVPDADDTKGSLEVFAEAAGQLVVMYMGLYFINRMVTYSPTFSGVPFSDIEVLDMVPATLLIILSLQTKVGEKFTILFDRVIAMWDGKEKKETAKDSKVKVTQPLSSGMQGMPTSMAPPPPPQPPREMPTNNMQSSAPQQQQQQQSTDFNSMYQGPNMTYPGAQTPGMMDAMEPMAADSFSTFGTAF